MIGPIEERLAAHSKRDQATGCLIWQRADDCDGYGKVWYNGRTYGAHRAAFIVAYGDPGPGMDVDHKCFNPPCIERTHLQAKPLRENRRSQLSAWKTVCVNGHELNDANVYVRHSRWGTLHRQCRPCSLAAGNRYRARIRGNAVAA